MSNIAPRVTTPVRYYSFAHSLAIRARAILPIYAKIIVALARAACHHTPMRIYECCWVKHWRLCEAARMDSEAKQLADEVID